MPRRKRIARGNLVYHVLNRANGRLRIFRKPADFEAFEAILAEGLARFDMRLCGYCVMATHWHLVLWPRRDGDLSQFMKWLTGTHSHRWHGAHGTLRIGHLYQGRYRSFPVQEDVHYLTLMRYVESNPLRAGLVRRSGEWPWSSLAVRLGADKPLTLSDGPVKAPRQWDRLVDAFADVPPEAIDACVQRGRPFGEDAWVLKTAKELSMESSMNPRGRPKESGTTKDAKRKGV
jgi:putative transposase